MGLEKTLKLKKFIILFKLTHKKSLKEKCQYVMKAKYQKNK